MSQVGGMIAGGASKAFTAISTSASSGGTLNKIINTTKMVGPVLETVSPIMAGYDKEKAHDINASAYQQEANIARHNADLKIARMKRQKESFTGMQIAAYAASGVRMVGSPVEVIIDSAAELEHDMAIARYNSVLDEEWARSRSRMQTYEGDVERRVGWKKGVTKVLEELPDWRKKFQSIWG